MTLNKLLIDLGRRATPPAASTPDGNLTLLGERLSAGDRPRDATLLERGFDGSSAPVLLVAVAELTLPITLTTAAIEFLSQRLGSLRLGGAESESRGAGTLRDELNDLLKTTAAMPTRERAEHLMDWIMERIDASRCALIPFESGTPGPPLVFKSRGGKDGASDPKRVPRKVVQLVARTRQPRISHNLTSDGREKAADETAIRQNVRSYMAVPVVFRGDLLAVSYVDRFDQARRFSDDERASFEAFAYELAYPLLSLRDDQRREEYQALRDHRLHDDAESPPPMSSPALERVLVRARKLAPHSGENLLILGETGVGKEVVARFVHEHSGRRERPFIAVNVSSISAELFESELMGSVRGAFTGAVDRGGRVVEADRGTLFLDEIGDLALTNQVKLLRFLQDKSVTPVGGRGTREVDVRVIAATNRPIDKLMQQGDFREDLFHRFAPPLTVPPLRERREEIVAHATSWMRARAREAGMREPRFTDEAIAFLEEYPWPGNVRQLEAVVAHAVLLASSDRIGRGLLESLVPTLEPTIAGSPTSTTTWDEYRSQRNATEKLWLKTILERHAGRVSTAARAIGVPLSTLRSLLDRHDLCP